MSVFVSSVEKVFSVRNLRIAGKLWHSGKVSSAVNVFCLHGWLDNANSFDYLAPRLTQEFGANVFAIDLCGHGKSDWLPESSFYYQTEYAAFALSVLGEGGLDWVGPEKPPCVLIGHSMGAGVGSIVAGSFPEYFSGAIFFDGIGPVSEMPERSPDQFRAAFESEKASNSARATGKFNRKHAHLDHIVALRQAAVEKFPGKQKISFEAAKTILERGTVHSREVRANGEEGSIMFSHDPRLNNATPLRFTEEQVHALLKNISCPTTAIMASDGWPSTTLNGGSPTVVQHARSANASDEEGTNQHERNENLLANPRFRMLRHLKNPTTLSNSYHHLHIDPDTRVQVGDLVSSFLSRHVLDQRSKKMKGDSKL